MKIEDFGEKIVGARKDLWMDLDHLDLYDEDDLHNYVRRDSIWPLPDAKAQIANGLDTMFRKCEGETIDCGGVATDAKTALRYA